MPIMLTTKHSNMKAKKVKYWQPILGKNWCYCTGKPNATRIQEQSKDKRHDYGVKLTTNINL